MLAHGDSPQHPLLTPVRIPVTSSRPQAAYLVAFDRDSNMWPTIAEARQLACFLAWRIARWYPQGVPGQARSGHFDVDAGGNGFVFRKHGFGDWSFRRRTWTMGPMYLPGPPELRDRMRAQGVKDAHTHDLPALLDRIANTSGGAVVGKQGATAAANAWLDWRAAHAHVFAVPDTNVGS